MKKSGFTLIELLAVIVVLAIIALIAVPIVLNIIEDSRKGAAEQSSTGYVRGIENAIIKDMLDDKYLEAGTYNYDKVNVDVNGARPTSGTFTVNDKGSVIEAKLCINNRLIEYKNGNSKQIKKDCEGLVPVSFEKDSWETIVHAISNGNSSIYHVGDTKEINLGNDLGTHTLRIANISTPEECSSSEFSQTACGFVVEFEDIIAMNKINNSHSAIGGWPATTIRTYINDTIYNALPDDLKNVIANTYIVSEGYGHKFYSTDKLYLLSREEVFGTSLGDDCQTSRQLDYYTSGSRLKKRSSGNNGEWWLRNAPSAGTFSSVKEDGRATSSDADWSRGVSPAFKIG